MNGELFSGTIGQQFAEAVLDDMKDKGWTGRSWFEKDGTVLVVQAQITMAKVMESGETDAWRACRWPQRKVRQRRFLLGRSGQVSTKTVIT